MEEESQPKKRVGQEIKSNIATKKSKSSQDFPNLPRSSTAIFNQDLFLPEEVAKIKATYQRETPFQHVEISNLLNSDFVAEVQQVFPKANWTKKKNDLYTFQQSQDLASFSEVCDLPICGSYYSFARAHWAVCDWACIRKNSDSI
jgi:hypothetical protein